MPRRMRHLLPKRRQANVSLPAASGRAEAHPMRLIPVEFGVAARKWAFGLEPEVRSWN